MAQPSHSRESELGPEKLKAELARLGFPELSRSQRRELEAGHDYSEEERSAVLAFRPSRLLAGHGGPERLRAKVSAALERIEPLYLKAVAIVRLHETLALHAGKAEPRTRELLEEAAREAFFRAIRESLGRERANRAVFDLVRRERIHSLSPEQARHLERLVVETHSDAEQQAVLGRLIDRLNRGLPLPEGDPDRESGPEAALAPLRRDGSDLRLRLGVVSEDPRPLYSDAEERAWAETLGRLPADIRQHALDAVGSALSRRDTLPSAWRDDRSRVRIGELLVRIVEMHRHAEEAGVKAIGSTAPNTDDKIEGNYIFIIPRTLPQYEDPGDIIGQLRLEEAVRTLRKPSASHEELVEASLGLRQHIQDRLAEGGSPSHAVLPLVSDLRQIAASLGSPLPEGQEGQGETADREPLLGSILEEQRRIEELRDALADADRAAKERMGRLVVQERILRRLTTSRISELRTGGMKYIERLRAQRLCCIVHKQGASKDKALLIPYSEGLSYSAEVPFKELSQRGGKLLERAQAGETLLLVDKRSRISVALIAPLGEELEEYWSKSQIDF